MFVLAELKDTIRIAPELFHMKLLDAIRDEINRKLANKVCEQLNLYHYMLPASVMLSKIFGIQILGSVARWIMYCLTGYYKIGRFNDFTWGWC